MIIYLCLKRYQTHKNINKLSIAMSERHFAGADGIVILTETDKPI